MDIITLFINLLAFVPLVLLFVKSKPVTEIGELNKDYLSIESTKSLRGICALCILFHHMTQQGYLDDAKIFFKYQYWGHLFVTIFFFLSGYGLMKQHMSSDKYRRKFLLKRLPSILLPFFVALGLYLLLESTFGTVYKLSFIIQHTFTTGNIDPFVPYAWYIIVILAFYLVFALLMLVFRNHYKLMVLGGVVWFVCHVLLCKKLGYSGWWYVTSFVLVIGMFFAAFEEEILAKMYKYYHFLAPIVWGICIASFVFHNSFAEKYPKLEVTATAVSSCLFAISIVLFLMNIKIGNKVSGFLGEISLEIYLFQAVWLKYLRSDLFRRFEKIYPYFRNPLIWSVLVILLTILTAFVLHMIFKFLLKYYKKLIKA